MFFDNFGFHFGLNAGPVPRILDMIFGSKFCMQFWEATNAKQFRKCEAAGAEVCGNQFSAALVPPFPHAWHPAKGRCGGSEGFAPARQKVQMLGCYAVQLHTIT